ncbi:hypothetical protein B0H66DRAFT_143291 [Apodospora peruviana]|uniref:Malate dehydrogenase n=1 Tax=Apodospora peruviana TaxID=516989 RepID=A0AAE0IK98_9PEZI|nr:hypothetical protein B0H66DRAFT_143291 [Apodospora peruviana]
MVSAKIFVLAALATVACAKSRCKPTSTSISSASVPTPTLPSTGGSKEVPAPPPTAVLKKIAVGHGLQNYTCTTASQPTAAALGALAVLYDVTALYPGTPGSPLKDQEDFDALTTDFLWTHDLPINFVDAAAYVADTTNPFPAPAEAVLGGNLHIPFLGHHYFDFEAIPMFDLSTIGLKASVGKNDSAPAPAGADVGPSGTGAVAWLQLKESGKGRSVGLDLVYRVITAGGNPESCAVTGPATYSIPYSAFYWFYSLS